MKYYVYILYSESGDIYYIGQTNNLTDRIRRHNSRLEKFTSLYCPWLVKCVIEKTSRNQAMALEKKLKNLNRKKLLKFIAKYSSVPGPRRGLAGLGADL